MKQVLKLMPLVATLFLAGCINLAPSYERPEAPISKTWPQGEAYQQSEARRAELPEWQSFIKDDRLKQLIQLGLDNSRDLKIAVFNIEKARAQYGVQRSALFPSIGAVANMTRQHTAGTLSSTGQSSTGSQYSAQLAMSSYELDFFGRVRNLNQQALQAYLQTEDARRTTQSTLVSDIANAWLTLGADQALLQMQQTTLKSQEESFKLIEASYKLGAASRLDYEQARSTVAAARASIANYIRAVAQDKNALTLLVGTEVPEDLLPTTIELNATLEVSLPEGLPSEVLMNRPDIASAERGMISANANIGAARAAFFPSVSLVASGGAGSTSINDLFKNGSMVWSFSPNINLPIFTGGLNYSNLQAANANQKIAVATYEKTIQSAFKEVADALAVQGTAGTALMAQKDYMESSKKAYELTQEQYKYGAVAYADVMNALRTYVSAQQAYISAELTSASSLVMLYRALGGGAEAPLPVED